MDNLRGSLLMVLAMAGFALEDAFVKTLARDLHVGHILMLIGAGGTVIFTIAALSQRDRLISRDILNRPLLLRNLGELAAAVCFVTALALADLSLVSAILQATPLAVTFAAALFLGETVGWRRWSAVAIGFLGVVMIIRPGLDGFDVASIWALAAVAALAVRDLATRYTPRTITSRQISAYAFATLIPTGAVMVRLAGLPLLPGPFPIEVFLGATLFGSLGYYGVVAAMRVGEVSFVSPFRYTRLLFAMIIGVVVFAERPDMWMLIGSAVIICSGLYTILREQQIKRRARRAR